MNAITTTSTRIATESKLARMFRAFCVEARRAIEIVGAAYQNGLHRRCKRRATSLPAQAGSRLPGA